MKQKFDSTIGYANFDDVNDKKLREKITVTKTTRRSQKTLNDFPSINEKFNDDVLLELFYGNDSEGINTQNDQLLNSTNVNGKYAQNLLFSFFFYL